jgi:hypothetical protein
VEDAPQPWRISHPLWQIYHHHLTAPSPEAIDSTPKATRPSFKMTKQMEAMPNGMTIFAPNILPARMGGCRAWPQSLHGSEQGFTVSLPSGAKRCKISLIGRPDAGSLARGPRGLTSAVAHNLSRNPEGEVHGFGS